MTDEAQRDAESSPPTPRAWVGVLWPAPLVLLLGWVPWDMMTCLLWAIGAIAALRAAWRAFKLRHAAPPQRAALIGALATVAAFVAALAALQSSLARADDLARRTATEVQAECRAARACPATPSAWAGADRTHGGLTSSYELRYSTTDDRSGFAIAVLHDIDHTLVIEGGVDRELAEREAGDGEVGDGEE